MEKIFESEFVDIKTEKMCEKIGLEYCPEWESEKILDKKIRLKRLERIEWYTKLVESGLPIFER